MNQNGNDNATDVSCNPGKGVELSANEKRFLVALKSLGRDACPREPVECGCYRSEEVMSTASWLRQKGLVCINEKVAHFYRLSEEGMHYAKTGLPERRAIENAVSMDAAANKHLTPEEEKIAVIWVKKKKLADVRKDEKTGRLLFIPNDAGRLLVKSGCKMPDELVLESLKGGEKQASELDAEGLKLLLSRKGVLLRKDKTEYSIKLTEEGMRIAQEISADSIEDADEISQLTPDHINEHRKGVRHRYRRYHVGSFAPILHGGKRHPIRLLMDDIRDVMVEMGFMEIEYDHVQSSFWNMDALFIPQDHPVRDIQDTYYLKNPRCIPISGDENKIAAAIAELHENGGRTGSSGWKYKWSREESEKAVLRTHTTVNTIRYLSGHPNPPVKVFSIGRSYRNEATDSTHLSELHQIEGIVMEEDANLAMLIGTLKEFYRRLGFSDIRVSTSYYPYTEPSLDVYVAWRGRILELGGAGIFRPEVTAPFGIKHNVLAWGLGLERLALIKWGLTDIRDAITNDLGKILRQKII